MITLYHGYEAPRFAFEKLNRPITFGVSKQDMAYISEILQKKAFSYPTMLVGPLCSAKNCDPLLKCLETFAGRFNGALYASHINYVPKTIISRCNDVVYCDTNKGRSNPYYQLALSIYKKPASVIKEALANKHRHQMRDIVVALVDIANEKEYTLSLQTLSDL